MNFCTITNCKDMKNICLAVICLVISASSAFAQQSTLSPEEKEKKLTEIIQNEVERLETLLKLEDWQVFYVDSILTNDYHEMQAEIDNLAKAKVSNADLYTNASDKWSENIYTAMRKVLKDPQWEKYLKNGAAREKKARDKRKEKMEKSAAK